MIMETIYKRLGFKKIRRIQNHLKANDVDYNFLKKVEIESLWNELIYANILIKYS